MAPLLALALEHRIEPEFTRTLIRERQLAAPSPATADWPWPLALRTLGEFVVIRDGTPLVSKGKAQKRPLEHAEGARGARRAQRRRLDADRATVARRRRRRREDFVRQRTLPVAQAARRRRRADARRGQAVARHPQLVWLDVWAFEQALDATPPDVEAALALLSRPLPRTRSAGAMGAAVARPTAGAARARSAGARTGAGSASRISRPRASLYERALELDNLAEAIYRRLMVCQRELGDPAGALTTYRRCRELLSIVLGRKPAAETEAIRASLVTA